MNAVLGSSAGKPTRVLVGTKEGLLPADPSAASPSGRETTKDRILAGALTALGHRGLRKLSIDDICNAASVSKRTLYRHFESRNDIIAGAAQHMRQQWELELKRAVDTLPDSDDRIRVVVTQLISFSATHPSTARLVANEIEFVRDSMASFFGEYVEMVRLAIEPTFIADPRLVSAGLRDRDVAELVLRFAMQSVLLPTAGQEQAIETFCTFWRLAVRGAAGEG